MKSFIVLFSVLCCGALAADLRKNYKDIPIISSDNVVEYDGQYRYSFKTGDGFEASQNGQLRTVEKDKAGEAVQGEYKYTDDEGNTFQVSYTADENGYQVQGAHLPTPPPIPEAIAKALQHLATKPPPKDGEY